MKSERLKITVRGAVQGVGFRPFVFRLATELNLRGTVLNSSQGVFIEVEGERALLNQFLLRLEKEKPPRAIVQSLEFSFLDAVGHTGFQILPSENQGEKTALILPDIATCPDCLGEIFDPQNRRYLYPFTNCTNCGPRFSIIESLPYDRANTSMKNFTMCAECQCEYHDPRDRRFHAQPNACSKCGPRLESRAGVSPAQNRRDARSTFLPQNYHVLSAADALRSGQIVALKGIGGFQLLVDARNEKAVQRLRERKHREEKPFAVMYPSLEAVRADCEVSELEARLLQSPEAPIVLLSKLKTQNSKLKIADAVAPNNPYLGVMLPYSPLHHILMRELNFPIVATSGNASNEPMCIDEDEAVERLSDIADLFLIHNRPIVRPVDDSIVRVTLDRELVIRRARGYAPLPISIKNSKFKIENCLAVGAHLKNSVALAMGDQVFISQHIGDLETPQALQAFRTVAKDLQNLYEANPQLVACDLHPEYLSTKFAQGLNRQIISVQHHYAHIVSCMAENEINEPVLGIAWDGTGYGLDGTIWGGEFLLVNPNANSEQAFTRFAHFRNFPLPGGETAIKQPRRIAFGLLWKIFGEKLFEEHDLPLVKHFSASELSMIHRMLVREINCPVTSSVGRLFDAVASLIGLRQRTSFEGQAGMELEFAIDGTRTEEHYSLPVANCQSPNVFPAQHQLEIGNQKLEMILDWQLMILQILDDVREQKPISLISAKFHNALVNVMVNVARMAGETKIVLSGGCFQNKYLLERAILKLRDAGFQPYWHQRVPTNDGGIALGQAVAALCQTRNLRRDEQEIFDESKVEDRPFTSATT